MVAPADHNDPRDSVRPLGIADQSRQDQGLSESDCRCLPPALRSAICGPVSSSSCWRSTPSWPISVPIPPIQFPSTSHLTGGLSFLSWTTGGGSASTCSAPCRTSTSCHSCSFSRACSFGPALPVGNRGHFFGGDSFGSACLPPSLCSCSCR